MSYIGLIHLTFEEEKWPSKQKTLPFEETLMQLCKFQLTPSLKVLLFYHLIQVDSGTLKHQGRSFLQERGITCFSKSSKHCSPVLMRFTYRIFS